MRALARFRTARILPDTLRLLLICGLLLLAGQAGQGRNAEAAIAQSTRESAVEPVRAAAARTGTRPGWVTRYWSAAGAGFRPDLGTPEVAGGCLLSSGPALEGRIALSLPQGAHVTYLSLNGQDPNAEADMVVTFRQTSLMDGAATYSQEVWTYGALGWGSWGNALDHTIDYSSGAYTLLLSMSGTNATGLRFCSTVIEYEVPITNALLPVDLYNP